MSMNKTFKDFFTEKLISVSPFKKLHEMAIRHDISKLPVNIDKDDIEFLNQFPHAFWRKALQMRYDMLYDAIEKLHKDRRLVHKHDEIKDSILKAMEDGQWDHLAGIVPDNEIYHLKKVADNLSPKEKVKEADKLAHEYVKTKTPHLIEPKDEVPFEIKGQDFDPESGAISGSNARQPTQTFMAKPFLNRLYHKLERTKGEPHIPGSGLEGESGKYGYDMAYPERKGTRKYVNDDGEEEEKEFPHSTEGMRFPSDINIAKKIGELFNVNMHRIVGKLPEDAVWLKTGIKDTWSAGYVKQKLKNKWFNKLQWENTKSGGLTSNDAIWKLAEEKATKELLDLVRSGQLKGPPVPGKFPEGQTIELEGEPGQETISKPDLYLPFQMRPIKTKQPDGSIKTANRMVPIVNPAHFFRELGGPNFPEDYAQEIGPDGKPRKKFDDEGNPIWNVPKEKLRGYENQFVHVGDDEWVDDNRQRQLGAFDFNHDSEGKLHLTKGDPRYQEAFEKVFGEQIKGDVVRAKFVPNKNGSYYKDIAVGLLQCYTSSKCGGATSHERSILLQSIFDFHQIVVEKMLENLRDENLYEPEGRMAFARNKVSSIMQKDQENGGGSRRLRKLTQDARMSSLDATTKGKEGGDVSIADKLNMSIQDKSKLGMGGNSPVRLSGKRGRGNRKQDTSGLKTPYNLETMRETLAQLKQDAQQADATSEKARMMSRRGTGAEIIEMLRKGINDKSDVLYYITDLLTKLYDQTGNKNAKKNAEEQIKSWTLDGVDSAEKLLAQFERHPLVQQAMGLADPQDPNVMKFQPADQNGPQEDEKESLDLMNQEIERMGDQLKEKGMDINNPQFKRAFEPLPDSGYSPFLMANAPKFRIAGVDRDRIMQFLQKNLNQRFGVEGQQTAAAAKDVALKPQEPQSQEPQQVPLAKGPWTRLKAAGRWLQLAHHMSFLQTADPRELINVENNIKAMQGQLQPHEFTSAMNMIQKAKQQRGIQ